MTLHEIFKIFIVYVLLISRGMIALDQKQSISAKFKIRLNECERCKLLTESFNTWFTKTSRGKHEGGDTAWEEAKLKSYARSEMRLVEIEESLCSEIKTNQDHCYALAEEAEQLLETWWYHDNSDSLDLFTWLCIENLQYCCPPNHFGEQCSQCPLDINNKLCGGNGKCDGDGTRKGNGTCVCNNGYSGTHCDECSSNFYKIMNECKPCHRSCKECQGDGSNFCVQCTPGWTMEMGVCVDINECLGVSSCKTGDFCINREGSYVCKLCDTTCKTCVGPGPKNCTSCKPFNILLLGKCLNQQLLMNGVVRTSLYCLVLASLIKVCENSRHVIAFAALILSFLLYYEKTLIEV